MEFFGNEQLTITTTLADGMELRNYLNIESKWDRAVYCFFFKGWFYTIMGYLGPMREVPCKDHRADAGGSRADSLWRGYMAELDYYLIGKKTDYSLLEKTDIHLLLGIKGSVDIKLSKGIDALKHSGYLFETKIFTGMCGTAVLLVSILINRQRKCGVRTDAPLRDNRIFFHTKRTRLQRPQGVGGMKVLEYGREHERRCCFGRVRRSRRGRLPMQQPYFHRIIT